jgi:hypothetical protein
MGLYFGRRNAAATISGAGCARAQTCKLPRSRARAKIYVVTRAPKLAGARARKQCDNMFQEPNTNNERQSSINYNAGVEALKRCKHHFVWVVPAEQKGRRMLCTFNKTGGPIA